MLLFDLLFFFSNSPLVDFELQNGVIFIILSFSTSYFINLTIKLMPIWQVPFLTVNEMQSLNEYFIQKLEVRWDFKFWIACGSGKHVLKLSSRFLSVWSNGRGRYFLLLVTFSTIIFHGILLPMSLLVPRPLLIRLLDQVKQRNKNIVSV